MILYTIGHSRYPIDHFLQLLVDHGIEQLLDVRSSPYSRFNPQYNKARLQQSLLERHIQYVYAGAELGGRPTDPSCYKQDTIPGKEKDFLREVDYLEVMKRPWFIEGIQQLHELADQHVVTIMCSEEDPARCHRHHLIATYLLNRYPEITILHIRGNGSLLDAKSTQSLSDGPNDRQLSF